MGSRTTVPGAAAGRSNPTTPIAQSALQVAVPAANRRPMRSCAVVVAERASPAFHATSCS